MLRTPLALFVGFFVAVCALSYWNFVLLRPEDREAYRQMMDSQGQKARHALEIHPATQRREEVQKDIWVPEKGQRLHFRLKSRESELILQQRKGKIEGVEKLRGLECWLQERLMDSGQQVRHWTAEAGVYFFPSHRFLAEKLDMHFLRLAGHALPESIDLDSAFLSAEADDATFSAYGKTPTFQAKGVRAAFDPTRGAP